jgi:hypothetical protein
MSNNKFLGCQNAEQELLRMTTIVMIRWRWIRAKILHHHGRVATRSKRRDFFVRWFESKSWNLVILGRWWWCFIVRLLQRMQQQLLLLLLIWSGKNKGRGNVVVEYHQVRYRSGAPPSTKLDGAMVERVPIFSSLSWSTTIAASVVVVVVVTLFALSSFIIVHCQCSTFLTETSKFNIAFKVLKKQKIFGSFLLLDHDDDDEDTAAEDRRSRAENPEVSQKSNIQNTLSYCCLFPRHLEHSNAACPCSLLWSTPLQCSHISQATCQSLRINADSHHNLVFWLRRNSSNCCCDAHHPCDGHPSKNA